MKTIVLTQGFSALVDDEDFDFLSQWKWFVQKGKRTFYAVRHEYPNGRNFPKKVLMHRLIMKTPSELVVDHKNRNGLDNRKINLKNCTINENNQNVTYSNKKDNGISWYSRDKKWVVRLQRNKKRQYLGFFISKLDAIKAVKDFKEKSLISMSSSF